MYEIVVQPFGDTFVCAEGETILSAALREHRFLRYGCRHGGCGTCKVQLVDGDVDLTTSAYALPPAERDAGTILVCQSYPVDDCEIDASAMNLDHEEYLAGDGTLTVDATLARVEYLTADIRRVVLDLSVPMPFTAGQFVNVVVPGTALERTYSRPSAEGRDRNVGDGWGAHFASPVASVLCSRRCHSIQRNCRRLGLASPS